MCSSWIASHHYYAFSALASQTNTVPIPQTDSYVKTISFTVSFTISFTISFNQKKVVSVLYLYPYSASISTPVLGLTLVLIDGLLQIMIIPWIPIKKLLLLFLYYYFSNQHSNYYCDSFHKDCSSFDTNDIFSELL